MDATNYGIVTLLVTLAVSLHGELPMENGASQNNYDFPLKLPAAAHYSVAPYSFESRPLGRGLTEKRMFVTHTQRRPPSHDGSVTKTDSAHKERDREEASLLIVVTLTTLPFLYSPFPPIFFCAF